jgi:hypothetical protein
MAKPENFLFFGGLSVNAPEGLRLAGTTIPERASRGSVLTPQKCVERLREASK